MAAIYQAAAGVLAWLGPAYENSDIVMAKLPNMSLDIGALNRASWSLAMSGLCVRAYWRRLWVWQELKLAKQRYIMCGTMAIQWEHFETFMNFVDQHADSDSLTRKERALYLCSSPAMRMIKLVQESSSTALYKLLETSAHLQCEESRDRAYALLGFATSGIDGIEPDYTVSLPTLLNRILSEDHRLNLPGRRSNPQDLLQQCEKLERLFNVRSGSMFATELSPRYYGQFGPLPRRLHMVRLFEIPLVWTNQPNNCHARNVLLDTYLGQVVFSGSVIAVFLVFGLPALVYAIDTLPSVNFVVRTLIIIRAIMATFLLLIGLHLSRKLYPHLPATVQNSFRLLWWRVMIFDLSLPYPLDHGRGRRGLSTDRNSEDTFSFGSTLLDSNLDVELHQIDLSQNESGGLA